MWLTSSFEGVRPVLADVSHAVAQEILRRLGLKGARCPQRWKTSSIATSAKIVSDASA